MIQKKVNFKKLIYIIFLLTLSFSIVKAEEVSLYSGETGEKSLAEIKEMWPSNNERIYRMVGTRDGETDKKYFAFWSNFYTDSSVVQQSTDKNGMTPAPEGEPETRLEIYLNNLNIDTSLYQDIRLNMNFFTPGNAARSMVKIDSLEVYVMGSDNQKYGPYHMYYFEPTDFYRYAKLNDSSVTYGKEYNVVTENIKIPNNLHIKKVIIRPYGNYPTRCDEGQWRCSEGSRFDVSAISIKGYKNANYQKPSYVTTETLTDSQVNELRTKIIHNMYDLATVKWKPSENMYALASRSTDGFGPISTEYQSDTYYYGVPYTQRNRATVKRFSKALDSNKIYTVLKENGEQSTNTIGDDCASSVMLSYAKYTPYLFITDTADYTRNKYVVSLLGNLELNTYEDINSSMVYENLKEKLKKAGKSDSEAEEAAKQEIYKGYQKLKIGDFFAHYIKGNKGQNHVAYVSGNVHVECVDGTTLEVKKTDNIPYVDGSCDSHGGINPENSYFIRTDISSGIIEGNQVNNYKEANHSSDYVASATWTANSAYTDINTMSDLEEASKKITFRINQKITFKDALDVWYMPATLNVYKTKQLNKPYARIENPNTVSNIKDGFKGTILSNYFIESVTFYIKNVDKGEETTITEYPNHSNAALEENAYGVYSLYYNTSESTQTKLKNMLKNADQYIVKVTAEVGEEKKEILKLSTVKHTVTFNSNGGSEVASQQIKNGSKATKPASPTKKGYTFKGWYKEEGLINEFNFDTKITKNITLYAKWEKGESPKYEYLEGKNQTYKLGEDEEATFRIDADFSLFSTGGAVYIDGKLVAPSNYTAKSGSTIITFKKAYMNSLSQKKHTLRVEFNNGGYATTDFMVQSNDNSTNNPDTADVIFDWISLFILSMIGLGAGNIIIKTIKQ